MVLAVLPGNNCISLMLDAKTVSFLLRSKRIIGLMVGLIPVSL